MTNAKKEKAAPQKTSAAPQPLFYRNPVPILQDRHLEAGLGESTDYNFAKATNSVSLNIQEFVEACKHYPIAFTSDGNASPVAILGIEDKKNFFVNKLGEWKTGVYIPAYVRRYPFALMAGEGNNLILCVDEGSERFIAKAKKGDSKFFENDQQSVLLQNAIGFCSAYHRDHVATQAFSKELKESGLLVDKQVSVSSKGKKKMALGGFSIVDEQKLQNLSDETLKRWHKNGYLALIYIHLLSGSNWSKLANLQLKS